MEQIRTILDPKSKILSFPPLRVEQKLVQYLVVAGKYFCSWSSILRNEYSTETRKTWKVLLEIWFSQLFYWNLIRAMLCNFFTLIWFLVW